MQTKLALGTALSALAASAVLAACTASAHRALPSPTRSPRLAVSGWHEVPLPANGARVLVLSQLGGSLLALGSIPAAEGRAPAAWTTTDAHVWHRLTLTVATGYGRQAEFIMGGVEGGHVAAFGQAYGGAHSNPRPTLWEGDARQLTEHEQVVTMFGGEDVISVNGEAARPGTVLLAGGWDGASGRYGAAVWTSPDGATWTRYADAPGLTSAPGEQTTALGAAPTADGFLVLGDTILATPGHLSTVPLAWMSSEPRSWQRITLPSADPATASRAACGGAGCVVIGNTATAQQHLLCWTVDAAGRPTGGEPGPGRGLVQVRQVFGQENHAYVISDIDRVAHLDVVSNGCTGWAAVPLPAQVPDAAVSALGSQLVLATTTAQVSRLWLRG